MESRILYLEKELGILRKRFSLMENSIQNDLKNYIDEYLKAYLDNLQISNLSIVGNGKVKQDPKATECELVTIKKEVDSPKILNISRIKKEKDDCGIELQKISDLAGQVEDSKSSNHKNCKIPKKRAASKNSDNDNSEDNDRIVTEYRVVDGEVVEINNSNNTDGNSMVVEMTREDVEMMTSDDFEPNPETDVNEAKYLPDIPPTITIGSMSIPNTTFYLPTIISMARENASHKAETAIIATSTPPSKPPMFAPDPYLPFQCEVCQLHFKCASHLEKHKVKHVEDRPFACEYCGKAYKRVHHLKEHKTLRHPEYKPVLQSPRAGRRYRCLQCSKIFLKADLLAAHTKTHAPEGGCVRKGIENSKPIILAQGAPPQFQGFNLTL